MKVCFITPYPLRMISGVSQVVINLCKGLEKRKIDHLVITSRSKDEIEKDKAIKAIEISVSRFNNFRDTYLAIKTVFSLFRYRKDIDILHLHSPHLQPMLSAISGRLLGKPVVITLHGKFPKPRNIFMRVYFRITTIGTIAFSDKVTFVDEEARKHYKVPSGEVIENGIDTQIFLLDPEIRTKIRSKLGLSQNDIVLLYLGRLAANKGIYELLGAVSAARTNKRLKLILVGSGEMEYILERIKSLGLGDNVLLYGGTKDVKPYYCASDIFVLYSGFEGLPMVLLEASSYGLAIISTRVGGIPNLITDGENGLLIEYGDKEGLKQKIIMIAKDDRLRKQLGNNARERVAQHYDIRKTIDRYVDLYKRVLKGKEVMKEH